MRKLLFALLLALMSHSVLAVIETYEFASPELRDRYHVFVQELRCPKCQNQNLADSNAGVAADLRREVHRLLHEGYTDQEIYDFMVSRYGEFVLYRPKTSGITLYLWLAPAGLLILALGVVFMVVRRAKRVPAVVNVVDTDKEALKRVLDSVEEREEKS
jgi:cytochrome c-type biogenesis protein CcmH